MQCGLCLSEIKNKKSYRKISDAEFSIIGLQNLGISTACSNCFNRLNKVKYFEKDMVDKINKLKIRNEDLVKAIRDLPGVRRQCAACVNSSPSTSAIIKKRHSQSPPGESPKRQKSIPENTLKLKVDKSTQTTTHLSDFKVKSEIFF